jgi:hypothetical protein
MATVAERRLLAWKTYDCKECGQPIGRRCRDAGGALTVPHPSRLLRADDRLAGRSDRDAEVAALLASELDLTEALSVVTEQRDIAQANSVNLAITLRQRADQVSDLAHLIRSLLERIKELETPPKVTRFGACPAKGASGATLEAQRRPFLKYGPCTVRQFFGTEIAPRAIPTEVLRLHASWNLGSMVLADLTPAWVQEVTANLLANDEVEVIHEADKKVTDGKRTYEECVAFKNRFFDLVEQVRPDLVVVNTLTGGTLSEYGGTKEERWGAVKAHLLGVDCDGVHDKTAPLDIPYEDEMASALAFVEKYAANGYRGITVPEFGTSRPSYDTDGTQRAAWIRKCAAVFIAAGSEEVNAYDYESTAGNEFATGSPEYTAWREFTA